MKNNVNLLMIIIFVLVVLLSNLTLRAQNPQKKIDTNEVGFMMITLDSLLTKEMRITKGQYFYWYPNIAAPSFRISGSFDI